MQIIKDIDQRSDQWFHLRLNSIGGSGIKKVTAKGQGKVRTTYLRKLAYQTITGRYIKGYQDSDMVLGNESEPEAIKAYSFFNAIPVEQVGMVINGDRKHYSPDSLTICGNGLVEVKNINEIGFVEVLQRQKYAPKHDKQMQWGLSICEREWCDFVQSHYIRKYDDFGDYEIVPGIEEIPIWTKRVYRDEKLIKELHAEADRFLEDLDNLVERIKKR
ncbi:MAG: YqaJ viral recombinase family protein [Candidatus Bathyarchaeota archaeon]|jgi:hypothetical protein